MKAGSIFVLVLTLNFCQARLERTKLVSGSVYALESQHDGAVCKFCSCLAIHVKLCNGVKCIKLDKFHNLIRFKMYQNLL